MQQTCECGKYQFSHIPCTHVIIVARFNNLSYYFKLASIYYFTEYLQKVYKEDVNLIGHQLIWAQPTNPSAIYPPIMQWRQFDHPSNHAKRPSQGEKVEQHNCSWCHQLGYNRLNYSSLTFYYTPKKPLTFCFHLD